MNVTLDPAAEQGSGSVRAQWWRRPSCPSLRSRPTAIPPGSWTARCASPSSAPDPDYDRGLALLRAGRWFDAHEALEDAWRRAEESERDFLQGLVHIAVAWYQAGRRKRIGTERQLEKARRRLAPYAPSHRGLDVTGLLHSVDAARGRFPDLPRPVAANALPGGPGLERARAFTAQLQERSAARSTPFPYGTVFSDPSLPGVYDLNITRLDASADGLDAEEVSRAAEEAHAAAGHPHRKLLVPDAAAATALAPGLRDLGWTVERYLVMTAGEPPAPGRHFVEEIADADLDPSRRAFIRGYEPLPEDLVAQLAGIVTARRRGAEVRSFAHREGGVPVSWCELYSADGVGQVESVSTLADKRGRGYASSVVAHATRESRAAGNELTFLVVEELEGPVALYERLGYAAVGRDHAFAKPPKRGMEAE